MTTYHFCALTQHEMGSIQYFDGTVQTEKNIGDRDEYQALKRDIGSAMDPPTAAARVTIISLTPISAV